MNMRKEPFQPGQPVLIREIWDGKIWTVRPFIIVQDNSALIVIYHPAGTHDKRRRSLTSEKITGHDRKYNTWILEDASSDNIWTLKMAIPGEDYSVITFWNAVENVFICWYINLEDPDNPMHRTAMGYDCTDQILDLVIEPDLKHWHWEDEDELQEAIEAGVISPEKARVLYIKGEKVRDMIMSGKSIFNGWEHWKPDPSWEIPILPDGWDIV